MFSQFAIRTRLLLLMGLLGAIQLALAALGTWGLTQTNRGLTTVFNDRVIPLVQLRAVNDMYAVNIVDTAHKVESGALTWDEGLSAIAEAKERIEKEWSAYLATYLTDEEQQLIDEVKPRIASADAATSELQRILIARDHDRLVQFRSHELYPQIDPVTAGIDDLTLLQERVAREEYEAARVRFREIETLLIGMAVGGLVLGFVVAWAIIASIANPLSLLTDATNKLAHGNLSIDLQLRRRGDEIGQLQQSFMTMAANLREMIKNLQTTITNLTSSATEISATAQETSSSASEQASTVAEVTATVEEVSQTAQSAAQGAQEVRSASEQALKTGRHGIQAIDEAVETMKLIAERVEGVAAKILDLSEKNAQIRGIVDTVNDLAEQSNLLAVNASIEAAKAGEQGRGFSVVASEVRTLAVQSKRATAQIRDILSDIQKATESAVMATEEGTKRVDDGRRAVGAVRGVIQELAQVLEENSAKSRQIAAAVTQQSAGMGQISTAIEGVSQSAEANSTAAKNLEAAVVQITSLAGQLKENAERYTI